MPFPRDLSSLLGDLDGWRRSDRPFGPWQLARGGVHEPMLKRTSWPRRPRPGHPYFQRGEDRSAAAVATHLVEADLKAIGYWARVNSLRISWPDFPAWESGDSIVLTSTSARQPVLQSF